MAGTTITYIHHDCFLVETADFAIIFDFWIDPTVADSESPDFLKSLNPGKPLYIFVSHHHKDHYTRDIFSWAKLFPFAKYIISKDTARMCRHILSTTSIYAGPKVDPSRVAILRVGEAFSDNLIKVKAFGSTDIGNSYLVETAKFRLFHAGDLNAWAWRDEAFPSEIKQADNLFLSKIKDIEVAVKDKQIDFCFFPVDSRIGSQYYTGAKIFLNKFNVKYFFPMHFGLGDEQEQALRRRDAAKFNLYSRPGIVCIGPLSPYGSIFC